MTSPFGKKVRNVAISVLTTAALAIPAVSALSVTGHDAGKAPVAKPASHRLAISVTSNSLRLT
jgi:hypothetical protein